MCYNSVISGVCVFLLFFFILRTDVMHIIEIICVVYLALMLITSIRVFGIICVKCGKNLLNLLGFDWDKRKFKKTKCLCWPLLWMFIAFVSVGYFHSLFFIDLRCESCMQLTECRWWCLFVFFLVNVFKSILIFFLNYFLLNLIGLPDKFHLCM